MATISTSALLNLVAEAGAVSEASAANAGDVAAKYSESVHDVTAQDLIQTYSVYWQTSSPCDRKDRDIDKPNQINIAAVGTCSEYNLVTNEHILSTSAFSCPLANAMEEELLSATTSSIRYCNDLPQYAFPSGGGITRLLLSSSNANYDTAAIVAHPPSTASHAADTSAPLHGNASNKRKNDYDDASRRVEYPTIWPHHDHPTNLQCYKSTELKELEHSRRYSIADYNSNANKNWYGDCKHHIKMQRSTDIAVRTWQQKRRALDPLPLVNNNVVFSITSTAAGANACNQQWQATSSAHRPLKVLKGITTVGCV